MNQKKSDEIRQTVRKVYGEIAQHGSTGCGCSPAPSCCGEPAVFPENQFSTHMGYSQEELASVPEGANMGLGCGNPQAIAALKPGETVLDLGSGGGFDCFLAARQVGPSGRVIGVDMTPEMVAKARENPRKAGYGNVEFRLGEIEHLPVADGTVDVIISNCVINLSPDKLSVYREAFRALKPGGRLAISDVALISPLPEELLNDPLLLSGCVSGAATIADVENMLRDAGFEEVRVQAKTESREVIKKWAPGRNLENYIASAAIEAVKSTT